MSLTRRVAGIVYSNCYRKTTLLPRCCARSVRVAPRLSARTGAVAHRSLSSSTISLKERPERPVQSASPLAPLGVNAAIQASTDPNFQARPKIFDEFSLADRVAVVSGANRGLGLEMALALCEAGARAVYCLDLPAKPSEDWECTKEYVKKLKTGGRLEYVSADVRDQKGMWEVVEEIGDKEGRMDVCVTAAGILKAHMDCLEYPTEQFKEVRIGALAPRIVTDH
jgi:hypothetical protein